MMSPIGIFGSNGYIGRNVCRCLEDHSIPFREFTGNALNVSDVRKFFAGDPTAQIIFLIGRFTEDYRESQESNVTTLYSVLSAGVEYGLKKAIFASSGAVYGNTSNRTSLESDPLRPVTRYGLAKKCAESVLGYFSNLNQIKSIILRFPNVYSEGSVRGVIYDFVKQARTKKMTIYGNGLQKRDFLYVEDAAEAIIRCLDYNAGGVFNITSKGRYSINDIAGLIGKYTDIHIIHTHSGVIQYNLILNPLKAEKTLDISFPDRLPGTLDKIFAV
ncbi:hypothetical protein A2Z33_05485 [Candidatus Gottesmanbacteria bacterium RBG_16_52_11]|uniref:NAD-dependent epimerase/dehydratase domain-containing protein n=1 Tax=Candidatus Gottesmanbacteria bacterium RBG_16_52_11 TaxID=1798374 RepID=A0A1F5YNG4_9BACT|nr:MAG: hypothetical protein A2Z33_05485 [Candidatus Gottesmanbacteria bacterium RBG_16_52_11]